MLKFINSLKFYPNPKIEERVPFRIKKYRRSVRLEWSDEEVDRMYECQNGDIFIIKNIFVEFEDGIFYEVIEEEFTFKNGIFPMKRYTRTGLKFTSEELNNL